MTATTARTLDRIEDAQAYRDFQSGAFGPVPRTARLAYDR